MKLTTLLGAILVLALLLTACGSSDDNTPQSPANTTVPSLEATEPSATGSPMATESAVATQSPAATASSATESLDATESPAATQAGGGIPVTGPATVQVSNVGDFGPVLVDGQGLSLYMFTDDTQNSGTSTCVSDECL